MNFDPFQPIEVCDHARQRARERDMPLADIPGIVRVALLLGHTFRSSPEVGHREASRDEIFAWSIRYPELVLVVKQVGQHEPPKLVVKTVLTRHPRPEGAG